MNQLKQLFSPPSAKELAAKELATAERSLLEAQSAAEYARSIVIYNRDRIERLRAYLEGKS
jgi:hypothetical protein